jgi:hypothetical protein
MEDNIYIARTKKEYKEGLKNPSKNIMYFPNANQMTMKGMKTPIKYYGITDGMITDEGYARPGQKFNVNGVSTLEVRMPQMRYGGRTRYQTSGQLTPEELKMFETSPQEIFNTEDAFDMVERVFSNPDDPNNKLLLMDPKFKPLVDAYYRMMQKNNMSPEKLLNNLIQSINTDPNSADNAVNDFMNKIKSYSPEELTPIISLLEQYRNSFRPEEYNSILNVINEKTIQDAYKGADIKTLQSNYPVVEKLDLTSQTQNRPFSLADRRPLVLPTFNYESKNFPDLGTTTPVVTTTTPITTPVVTTPKKPVFIGNTYPGYTIPTEIIGEGKQYPSVLDYQKRIREFLDETKDPFVLAGTNRGQDNTYGQTVDKFYKDPTMQKKFKEWESKKYPTTPIVITPEPVKVEPVKTEEVKKADDNTASDFGKRTLRYTDGTWYMTPSGSKYRTTLGRDIPENPVITNYPTINELPQGNYSNYESIRSFPSFKIGQKLQGAYDKLNQGFDDFANMIYSDRSDRAARRAVKLLNRAQEAEAIGQDRRAGRLYRKAEKQIARVEPLERIQDANEARKDYEAQMALDKMLKYKLALKENLANERMISAKAEAERTPEYWQSKGANKMYNQSAREDRRRERTEGKYNRAEFDASMEAERNKDKDESRDFRTGLNENYKAIKNQYEEENQNEVIKNRFLNKDLRAQRRYQNEVQGLKEDYAPTPTTEQFWGENNDKSYNLFRRKKDDTPVEKSGDFWGENDDKSYNIFRRKKELGGKLSRFQFSGPFTQGRTVTSPFNEPYQRSQFKLPDYSKISPTELVARATKDNVYNIGEDSQGNAVTRVGSGLPYSGQTYHSPIDPSFTLNFNRVLSNNTTPGNTLVDNKTDKSKNSKGPGMGFYGHTPGEFTQFVGTVMPAFYNLAQSMRKPHKFKEFQNPYAGRYLSNLASQYLPYDDSKIVAQQNRVMRNAQQQAPNFQIAQAYQMAGMDSLNRQLKDYQMKNFMGNQELAKQYNQASYGVAGEQQAIKDQAYQNDRKAQAALNQMQHKAVTQFGIGIHDLGKLMVNREMNAMDWSLMSQVYQQYGLAPFEAVMSGQISYDDMVKYKNNPVAMQELMRRTEKARTENAAAKQTQTTTTENYDNSGINASSTTTTTPRAGAAGGGAGTKKTGGKLFNLNVIKKY